MATATFDLAVPVGSYVRVAEGAEIITISNKRATTVILWAGDDPPPDPADPFSAIGHELKENTALSFSGTGVYATAVSSAALIAVTATG